MNIRKYYLRHQSLTKALSLDVITKGLGFLFIPLFLKCMSKEEFGLYSYLIFAVLNFSYLLKGGLDTSLTKLYFDYHGADKGKVVFTISTSILLIFLLFFLFCIFSNIDDWIFNKIVSGTVGYSGYFLPIMVYILLYNITATLNSYYIAASNVGTFQKWNLVKVLAQNLIAYLLVRLAFKTDKAAIRLLSESLAGIVFLLPLILHFYKRLVFSFDFNILKRALKIGLPTLGGVLTGIVYTFSDKFYLQKYSGIEILAVYNLGMLLATPIGILFGSFNILWLSEFFQENDLKVSFRKTTKVYIRFLLIYLLLFFVLMFGVWAVLKLNIIDKSYFEVLYVLPLIYLFRVLDNLCHLFDNFYIKLEKTFFTLVLTLGIGAVALTLFIRFIPVYGMFACAFILVAMELIRTSIMVLYIKSKIFAAKV